MSGATGKRQAIYTALQPFLPAAALQEAVEYWEQHFARTTGGTLHRFVTEVCQHTGLHDQRAEMLAALTAAMSRAGQATAGAEDVAATRGAPEATDEQLRAFERLIERIFGAIDPLTSEQLRTDLIMSLRRDHFSGAFLTRLRGWMLHRRPLRPVSVPAPALRATVNHLYVLMAERIGPVDSDRALHQATRELRAQEGDLADALAVLL